MTESGPRYAPPLTAVLKKPESPEEILAMLRALPVDPDPRTEEEDEIFAQLEAEVREGRRGSGPSTAEVLKMFGPTVLSCIP